MANSDDECRSCKAPIVWAYTAKGNRPMPLDRDPVLTGGNLYFNEALKLEYLARDSDFEGPRYVSHFVTCPDSKEHRRRAR